jgi:hypothetical protein
VIEFTPKPDPTANLLREMLTAMNDTGYVWFSLKFRFCEKSVLVIGRASEGG